MNDAPPPAAEQPGRADDDQVPPEHPATSDAPVSAGEVLSGEGVGTAGRAGPAPRATGDPPAAAPPATGAATDPDRRRAASGRRDDDLDAETVAEGIKEFLEPPARSPAADAAAPPLPG